MRPAIALAAAGLCLACAAAAFGADETRPRIASTALCGDLWALSLADRDQILSLSDLATGPYSALAEEAQGLPQNRGSIEELLISGADLVVTGHGTPTQTRRVLGRFGLAELPLEMATDLPGLAAKAPGIGAAFGHRDRGEDLAAATTARFAALAPPPGTLRPRVVYYRADGGGAGAGTIVDAVLSAAGYENLQARIGPPGWGGIPLEQVIMTPPEGYVVTYYDDDRPSARAVLGRNPVLARASAQGKVLAVPGKYWPCDHPVVVKAIETLTAARSGFAQPEFARPDLAKETR